MDDDGGRGARDAGRRAEAQLVDALREVEGVASRSVFSGVRVPLWYGHDADHGDAPTSQSGERSVDGFVVVDTPDAAEGRLRLGRGEIDVVVVTLRGIFAIEVKCWSGTVDVDPVTGRWLQTRARSGEVVNHGDVGATLARKASALAEHLARHGVSLPSGAVQPRLVFVNRNCQFTYAARTAVGNIAVLPDDFDAFVAGFQRSTAGRVADATLPKWLTGCALGITAAAEACAVIESSCRTWDTLTLVAAGSSVIEGDFVGLVAGGGLEAHSSDVRNRVVAGRVDRPLGQQRLGLRDLGTTRRETDALDFELRLARDASAPLIARAAAVASSVAQWGWHAVGFGSSASEGSTGDDNASGEDDVVAVFTRARPDVPPMRSVDLALFAVLGNSAVPGPPTPVPRGALHRGIETWLARAREPAATLDPALGGVLFHVPGEPSPRFFRAGDVATIGLSVR